MNREDIRNLAKPLLTNKYVLAVVIFLILLMVDSNSLFLRMDLSRKIDKLEQEKEYLKAHIAETTRQMNELKSSNEQLEKFAREEYFMKKDDEVVFIIKE